MNLKKGICAKKNLSQCPKNAKLGAKKNRSGKIPKRFSFKITVNFDRDSVLHPSIFPFTKVLLEIFVKILRLLKKGPNVKIHSLKQFFIFIFTGKEPPKVHLGKTTN